MARKTPIRSELVTNQAGVTIWRDWYCAVPPPGVPFTVVRSEWPGQRRDGYDVEQVREIRVTVICAGPNCGNKVESPRRRFCSDRCARRGRRFEKNVENPEFGQAAIRMIRAMARRTGANDIATFGMLWDLQKETAGAVVEAIDALREKGFSWADLGAEIHVSRNAVSQWHKRHIGKEVDAI